MHPTERIIAAIEGRKLDRVQTFCPFLEEWPAQQVTGTPAISSVTLLLNPVSRVILNHWGMKLKNILVNPMLWGGLLDKIGVARDMGFDSAWGLFEPRFMVWDSHTFALTTGSFYDIIDDGHNNVTYMYRGPAFTTEEAYRSWPHFHNIDDAAQQCYEFFTKALSRFGDDICIMGDMSGGLFESIIHSFGFENLARFIRKKSPVVMEFIDFMERNVMAGIVAMMDAGIRVIMKGDDMAFKTGPIMNPKVLDEIFGPPYSRITKAVHDRGGKIMIHSCGDNTKLFDHFIKWGFDGGHAFENTSNVDIEYEKKTHGDRFTIVGGAGVDYLLTARSRPEEVRDEVQRIIRLCAPGGRFILSPVHAHSEMDMEKVKIMLETVWEDGTYPISGMA